MAEALYTMTAIINVLCDICSTGKKYLSPIYISSYTVLAMPYGVTFPLL